MRVKKPNFFLRRRLSLYFPTFFVIILVAIYQLPRISSAPVDLTLFAVSTGLLGLYLGYVLSTQDSRIRLLTKTVGQEAVVFYKLDEVIKELPEPLQASFMQQVSEYLRHKNGNLDPTAGTENYLELLELSHRPNTKEAGVDLRELLIDNQQNRTEIAALLNSRVHKHEWFIMLSLYAVTLSFLLTFDYGQQWIIKIAAALLGASLGLLLIAIFKLQRLIHKKAWRIWEPFVRLIATNFTQLN